MRALLFDLDGTLTRSGGAGSRALGKALHARPQAVAELRKMRLDGMTDRAIARALLAAEGDQAIPIEQRMRVVGEAEIDAVLARYLQALAEECARQVYVAQPGVPELIERLRGRADALLGLCTGNVSRGAELKLTSAGLWGVFRFGGYGSDAEPRPDIVRAAWKRARELGATEGLVIGDTPRDVLAAHEAGLPACGVATGRWSVQQLAEHGAEVLLEDFADVEESERLLLGPL
ncbi:MAG TPA: HAD family hydrolase [Myxococcales bacterium]|nr:HAD family hydrolase [Myxococcales bacterium]